MSILCLFFPDLRTRDYYVDTHQLIATPQSHRSLYYASIATSCLFDKLLPHHSTTLRCLAPSNTYHRPAHSEEHLPSVHIGRNHLTMLSTVSLLNPVTTPTTPPPLLALSTELRLQILSYIVVLPDLYSIFNTVQRENNVRFEAWRGVPTKSAHPATLHPAKKHPTDPPRLQKAHHRSPRHPLSTLR
jgi:hypothetical protein